MLIGSTHEFNIREDNEKPSVDRNIFTYCSAAVILLMFVNLGTVLDLKRLKLILQRPIGPLIGFCGRYLIMPSLAFGLGHFLLKNSIELQLGLLFTAVSPSGGLANVCTIFLKGNINLSLTNTMVNSLLGLGMLPFWILVFIPNVYNDYNMKVPFLELAVSTLAIAVAIFIGVIFRLTIPKTTRFIFRYLKPLSIFLSVALVALTIGLNFFVFKELTINISFAVFLLPFIGYLLSFGLSKLFCRSFTDAMTIAVETSIISMTVPILLLSHSFTQTQLSMIIVIPIVSSLISLCLILILYFVRRACGWNVRKDDDGFDENAFLFETYQN